MIQQKTRRAFMLGPRRRDLVQMKESVGEVWASRLVIKGKPADDALFKRETEKLGMDCEILKKGQSLQITKKRIES